MADRARSDGDVKRLARTERKRAADEFSAKLSPDERIDRDRRAKWVAYRRKHSMADDAPFVGGCPWLECYQEALDALNYLEQIAPQYGITVLLDTAKWHARLLAHICLQQMETKGAPE